MLVRSGLYLWNEFRRACKFAANLDLLERSFTETHYGDVGVMPEHEMSLRICMLNASSDSVCLQPSYSLTPSNRSVCLQPTCSLTPISLMKSIHG